MPKNIDISGIYAAAIELFCERGFGGATTREVADRAGINEATLFRRFGSKAKLMEAALGDALADARFGEVTPSTDAAADLRAVVGQYLATYETHGSLALTLFSQLPHHPELGGITPLLLNNIRKVADLLAAHQHAGRIGPGEPSRFAVELIAPLAVLGVLKDMGTGPGHEGFNVDRYVRTYLDGHGSSVGSSNGGPENR